MIGRRILQQRPWNSARWCLCPFTPRTPSASPGLLEPEKDSVRPFYSNLSHFHSATRFLGVASSHFGGNSLYAVKRCSFSSNALPDVQLGGIVDVPLAQTGEGIAECELLKWYVQEGDQIEEFHPLCEVQSDKATIEITSRYKGKVTQINYAPGDIVKVGETLLKMFAEEFHAQPQAHDVLENMNSPSSEMIKSKGCGVLSTPAVRGLVKEYGVDITDIQGTGKDGRVLREDVLRYAVENGIIEEHAASTSSESSDDEQQLVEEVKNHQYAASTSGICNDETIPLRGFKRAMVKSMSMAAKVPHFYYLEEINCDALVELKTSFQENNTDPSIKHTFLPLLIKSLSMALSKYPLMNSCFNEESVEVILKGSHNIGIAMATPNGLVVPNIKNVQFLSILEITKELSRLQQLALENKLNPEDISEGTITLSNIGAIGGKCGSPLLNLPEVSIIAIGRIHKAPYFAEDGTVCPVSMMTVNIGADHRVLDGATVARFCNQWKQYIENPEFLMLQMR